MTNIRSRYPQNHLYGGGAFGGFIRSVQQADKNAHLRQYQPTKEWLQREKLALEQYLHQLKVLKTQGVRFVPQEGESMNGEDVALFHQAERLTQATLLPSLLKEASVLLTVSAPLHQKSQEER